MSKYFILDTNVLIHDPQALFAFKGAMIGIPIMVVQELDHFKGEPTQRGRNAREAIRLLDRLREQGSLAQGVEIKGGGTLRILLPPDTPPDPAVEALGLEDHDNKILMTAIEMKKEGNAVVFISKDLNMRVKADALGLETQDYKKETVAEDDFYKGWITLSVPASVLAEEEPRMLPSIAQEYKLVANQFVWLKSERNPENYRIFRYDGVRNFRAVKSPRISWPIGPRNPQQLMAFDLLFDDTVQLVNLLGPAGTGKTFIVLVAALHKVLVEHEYKKLLVARPVEPLGRDIGYLPGDIQEKIYSWMQPVRDNMELIAHKVQSAQERSMFEETHGAHDGDRKGKHRRNKTRDPQWFLPSIDELSRTDRISLEAITYMRGRSIPDQYILIDEVQNLTPHEVKTLITRVGEGSKIVLAGDPYQIDSPYLDFASNGLVVTSERFRGQSLSGTVFLETSERSTLSQLAAHLLAM
ncbi:MAG: PhoH family protein [Candidatus Babeliaceae bacterium]|nr:PhoH family protein [Candidatus Babeliaceae bacterium]